MCDPLGRPSDDALSDTLRGRRPQPEIQIRVSQEDTIAQGRGVVRTVFETCRGVPFKGHKSTVGCCLKAASEIGGGPGRKGGGGEGKPSPLHVFNTRRWVGELLVPCWETRF